MASTAACLSNRAFCNLAALFPCSEPLSISNPLLNVIIIVFFLHFLHHSSQQSLSENTQTFKAVFLGAIVHIIKETQREK